MAKEQAFLETQLVSMRKQISNLSMELEEQMAKVIVEKRKHIWEIH